MSHIIPVGYVMILYLSIFIAVIRGHSNILRPLWKVLTGCLFMTHHLTTRVPCKFQISVLNDTWLPWPLAHLYIEHFYFFK